MEYQDDFLLFLEQVVKDNWGVDWYPGADTMIYTAVSENEVWLTDIVKEKLKFYIEKSGGWWYWDNGFKFTTEYPYK